MDKVRILDELWWPNSWIPNDAYLIHISYCLLMVSSLLQPRNRICFLSWVQWKLKLFFHSWRLLCLLYTSLVWFVVHFLRKQIHLLQPLKRHWVYDRKKKKSFSGVWKFKITKVQCWIKVWRRDFSQNPTCSLSTQQEKICFHFSYIMEDN